MIQAAIKIIYLVQKTVLNIRQKLGEGICSVKGFT